MNKEELIQRLMVTFLEELGEHIRALNRDLLALEKAPANGRTELLRTLFRTVHSLKGAAHSVNMLSIEKACHGLESILGDALEGLLGIEPELIQLLFTVADALQEACARLLAKQEPGNSLTLLLPRIEAARHPSPSPVSTLPGPALLAGGEAPTPLDTPGQDGIIRVPAEKIDALLAGGGELLIARRRVGSRQEEMRALQDMCEQSQSEWLRAERPVRKLLTELSDTPEFHRDDDRPGTPWRRLPRRAMLAFERTNENFRKISRAIQALSTKMAADQKLLEQTAGVLDEEVRQVRMLPFGHACEGLERMIRDLARDNGKEAELVIEGSGVGLDRSILEGLKAPLMHLVRNAVDHGLESPEERRSKGKPSRGRIHVAASLRGTGVEIVVKDDGRGLDLDGIRKQAQKKMMEVPTDERDLARLIFQPGFTTTRLITGLSGRGVGLDVVKHKVDSLHGAIDFSFVRDQGTSFAISVPLTLTTLRAVLLACGNQTFALPTQCVHQFVRVKVSDLGSVEGREVLLGESAPVPVVALADILGIQTDGPRRSDDKLSLTVVKVGEKCIAFAVDELIAEQEFIVKNLGARLREVHNFSGGTILDSGRIALILNPADLVERAIEQAPERTLAAVLGDRAPSAKKRLLVVDDSLTTRSLVKSILEAAGFIVAVAADGADAWRMLQESGADLVISDVEMPRVNGFELTETIRGSKRFRETPVILVTALETARDKAKGLDAGADAYLPKSAFDQRKLLETIAQLL